MDTDKMPMVVALVHNDILERVWLFDSNEEAEKKFLTLCAEYVSNWDKISQEEKDSYIDDGYKEIGNPPDCGSICIKWARTEGD
jgi:hypothetical protein